MKTKLFLTTIFTLGFLLAISQTWTNLGTGINTEVLCLYTDLDNNLLYAGGEFTLAGGNPSNRIAAWNGSVWSAVGSLNSNSGAIHAIIKWNGNIYAGGWGLRPTGSNNYSNLIKWDGSSWTHVDLQLTGNTEINALAVYNGELYIAHDNDPGVTDTMPGFVKWDGSNIVDIGQNTPRGTGVALLAANGILYASGRYVYKWDGTEWDTLHIAPYCPMESSRALAMYHGKLIAGGNLNINCSSYHTNIRMYNETTGNWEPFNTYPCGSGGIAYNDQIKALHIYHDELFLGGVISEVNVCANCQSSGCNAQVIPSTNIGKWTGYNFIGLTPGLNYQVNCFAEYNDRLVIGGTFTTANGLPANHITLVETSTVGWIGFYNSVENNTYMETPHLLAFSQSNMIQPNILKICADGTKSTLIKFTKPEVNPAGIRFRIKGDFYGLNPSVSGKFDSIDYYTNGDTAIVRFTHPKHMPDTGLYLHDTIQVYDFVSGYVLFENPVRFYRAPVALIHGIWSNGDFWKPFEDELRLNGYHPALTYRMDYRDSNAVHFAQNNWVVPEAIRRTIRQARYYGFSAGAADIVAHSMGGVLSRFYLQSAEYSNNIHKLITVNSPHSGAQSCNLLLTNAIFGLPLRAAFYLLGMDCSKGAVEDFKVDGGPINASLNGVFLNYHKVPSHTITTYTSIIQSIIGVPDWVVTLIKLGAIATGNPIVSFPDILFMGQQNDLIVAEPSQAGGCITTTSFSPYWHSTWKEDNPSLYAPVINILKKASYDTVFFSNYGFYPPPQNSIFIKPHDINPYIKSIGDVMFTDIANGDTITSNQDFIFNIVSTGDIQRMMLIVSGGPEIIITADTTAPSASVLLHIDNRIFGSAKLLLVGYDSTGIIDMDSLTVVVSEIQGYSCSSINSYPRYLYLTPGTSGTIITDVQCSEGERNISFTNDCSYQIINPSVVINSVNNNFTGNQPGVTDVIVTYLGLTDTVTIVVDDTSYNPITSTIPDNNIYGNETGKHFVNTFPNPFNSNITFEVNNNITLKNAGLSILDMLGREVKRIENISSNRFDVGLRELNNGIYFYRFSTSPKENGRILTGKIVKGNQ